MGNLGEYRLVTSEPLLKKGYQTWPLPTDRPTVVGVSPNSGTIACWLKEKCCLFKSRFSSSFRLFFVAGHPDFLCLLSACDIVLPTKPLIPNLDELVRSGADFSAAANVTICFQPDLKVWEVKAEKSSCILVNFTQL
jgi:hypothetical protein